ncbi:hypothetical protein GJV85_03820 [Sulfurimonas aquatica]|uniref:DUF4381 domain-containing protein n=1 Tax=Sulfurimonas aquatica TaxID=2672570 RepID=A0A975GC56_9BACT|nr:hypothetical protein [Sulfurimonas aquatica]QSZ41270.1 hypothetical protein GJV85_03820 [Sulfurimonas aquatica]
MENLEIKIHDIKPLMEIQEYSLYYLIVLVVAGAIVLSVVVFFILKWFKNRNKFNIREEHKKLLLAIDFKDAKKAAYEITLFGATFKEDSQRHTKTYIDLQEKLEEYKYKKSVNAFDNETVRLIELYTGMIDV